MKKTYAKPVIEVESFQLNAAIATGCGVKLWYGENDCKDDDSGYFSTICQIDIVHPDSGGTFCYHGPITSLDTIFINS